MITVVLIIMYCFASVLIISPIIIPWTVHLSMNKSQHLPTGWGNYKKFLDQFYNYNQWETHEGNKNSFFAVSYPDYKNYYIHAGIIKFNGRCMNLDLISYYRFKIWVRKEWNRRNTKQVIGKVVW